MKSLATVGIESFSTTLESFRNGEAPIGISRFVGVSEIATKIRARIELAGRIAEKHLLVTGPTGAGKSLVAEIVHELSGKNGEFHALNCAAIPPDLVECELFGHEQGSFTGATGKHIGFFERASNGTLFLDEIGEATTAVQAKLLRVLENGEFYRLGGNFKVRTNARVIAATNLELATAIREKKFRTDLYYRLYGLGIHVPALKEHVEDLSYLAASFVVNYEKRQNGGAKYLFEDEAVMKLYAHPWPGNVRELRAVVENALLLCKQRRVWAENIEFPPIF